MRSFTRGRTADAEGRPCRASMVSHRQRASCEAWLACLPIDASREVVPEDRKVS